MWSVEGRRRWWRRVIVALGVIDLVALTARGEAPFASTIGAMPLALPALALVLGAGVVVGALLAEGRRQVHQARQLHQRLAAVWIGRLPAPPPGLAVDGWYVDPLGRFRLRYWDGARWTAHVSNGRGDESIDLPWTTA